jgi:hypothetical protein
MLYSVLKLNSREAVEFGEIESEEIVSGSEMIKLSMMAENTGEMPIYEFPAALLPLSRRPIAPKVSEL